MDRSRPRSLPPSRGRRPVQPARLRRIPEPAELAVRILSLGGGGQPVDAILRAELAAAKGLPRGHGRQVARLVFAYYRWRGWLNAARPWLDQLTEAEQLATRFAADPGSIPEAELLRAVPGWIADHLELRTDWLRSLQGEPWLWLRARPGTGEVVARELGFAQRPFPEVPDAVRYEGSQDLFRSRFFQEGKFEVQDLASQLVSLLAAPVPGQSWWDACAGEGGKTLHLADLMQNRGVVWATDRAEWRLDRLRLRASRAGLFNIRWAPWDGTENRRPPGVRFDGVLVDAPCSGVGTWQRNPDARWTTTPRDVEELAIRQRELLRAAAAGVKPGGRLIYAVCTLTRAETTEVAAAFAASAPDFEPESLSMNGPRGTTGESGTTVWIRPPDWGGNGMFVAAWRRVR